MFSKSTLISVVLAIAVSAVPSSANLTDSGSSDAVSQPYSNPNYLDQQIPFTKTV